MTIHIEGNLQEINGNVQYEIVIVILIIIIMMMIVHEIVYIIQ